MKDDVTPLILSSFKYQPESETCLGNAQYHEADR